MVITRRDFLEASAAASALAGLGLPADALAAAGPSSSSALRGSRAPGGPEGPTSAVVAGVVIETSPGAAPRVAARLLPERGLALLGGDGDRRLAAVFTGDARALAALAERLVRAHADVVGVFPTYVADEADDAPRDPPHGDGRAGRGPPPFLPFPRRPDQAAKDAAPKKK